MTRTISRTYDSFRTYQKQVNIVILAVSLILAITYIVNVYRVIAKTVVLQKFENQSSSINSEVRDLDAKYLELSNAITPDSLSIHGYIQTPVSIYISRTSSLGRIAYGGHEL